MTYKFECAFSDQSLAVLEFNNATPALQIMHKGEIKFVRMYKKLFSDWIVEYEVEKMTEEIINSDGSRNWQANILLDNAKRLEQENKKLKKDVQLFKCLDTFGESECHCACRCLGNEFCEDADKKINTYRSALEEINLILDELKQQYDYMTDYSEIKEIQDKINEVLND